MGQQPFIVVIKNLFLSIMVKYTTIKKSEKTFRHIILSLPQPIVKLLFTFLKTIIKKLKAILIEAIKRTVAQLDGIYVLAIREQSTGNIVLVRDGIGVRQIYYGESNDFIAFASERKALWKIAMSDQY